jgi:putative tryptophan/tyrosine transport system substrate-binding protein
MTRRQFLSALSGALAMWPIVSRAQQPRPTIGFLSSGSPATFGKLSDSFRQGLSESGWTEGVNLSIHFAWAETNFGRLPALAADLVARHVSLIYANSVAVRFAKNATSTIPIVFTSANDPVEEGLVANINRPGGNATGISLYFGELGPKRLELLQELVPSARIVAVLGNPSNPSTESYTSSVRRIFDHISGKELQVFNASDDAELELAFSAMRQRRADALLIAPDPFFGRSQLLIELANRHGIPAIHTTRDGVAAGGLVSYGTSLKDAYRQAGVYAGRILKGERPGDLPVMQPTKFELAINLNTAKALGITVPPKLLFTADEVIE